MISIGVIGCGAWGPNHIRVFNALENSRVEAAADTDAERLRPLARLFPDVRRETDPTRVIADPSINAVVVATPTATHYEVIRDALRHGKHVLSEKPLAETAAQGEELVALAEANAVVLLVGHVFLFNPGIVELREALKRGEVGQPLFLSAVRTNLGPIRSDVNAAYDLATHDISIFNWLLGSEPERVSATGASFLQPGIEDVVSISLKYPLDVFATIQASWLNPKKVRQITVVGDRGMMFWDDLELSNPVAIYDKRAESVPAYSDYGEFLRVSMSDGDVRLPKVQMDEPLRAQATHFLECIEGECERRANGEDGIKVIRTLEAIARSLEANGAPVNVAAAVDA